MSSLEIGLRQSKNALSILLGLPPDHLADLLGNKGAIPSAPPDVAVGIPAEVVRRRPDVRREEFKAAAQSAMIGVTQADLFPRFSLQGSIGLLAGSTQGVDAFDVFGAHAMAAKIGPTVTWPILHYGRLKNNVRVQDARFQELLIGYQNAVLKALREVEDAMVAFLRPASRWPICSKAWRPRAAPWTFPWPSTGKASRTTTGCSTPSSSWCSSKTASPAARAMWRATSSPCTRPWAAAGSCAKGGKSCRKTSAAPWRSAPTGAGCWTRKRKRRRHSRRPAAGRRRPSRLVLLRVPRRTTIGRTAKPPVP
ncbi:TolC family protein [Methylogaea oryzae]|uniref:TolC family protein n=1 Tax=Methylogaea oryzae TaxID=1295382 RepID=UPI00278BB4C2|nr:TolC family protein [Methylogaea oryzae]